MSATPVPAATVILLRDSTTSPDVLLLERPVVPVLPRLVEQDGERRLIIPEDAGYGTAEQLAGRVPG